MSETNRVFLIDALTNKQPSPTVMYVNGVTLEQKRNIAQE